MITVFNHETATVGSSFKWLHASRTYGNLLRVGSSEWWHVGLVAEALLAPRGLVQIVAEVSVVLLGPWQNCAPVLYRGRDLERWDVWWAQGAQPGRQAAVPEAGTLIDHRRQFRLQG